MQQPDSRMDQTGPDEMPGRLDRNPAFRALRARVARMERGDGGPSRSVLATGFPQVDQCLPDSGLPIGMVHEITGGAADAFVLHLLSRLSGMVLWCQTRRHRGGMLYGPGLAGCGFQVANLLICRGHDDKQCLWAMEEALRSGLLGAVVGEPGKKVDLTASRRLQLAAERGRCLGLVLSGSGREAEDQTGLSPSAVFSRWHVATAPTDEGEDMAWNLTLRRCRGGARGHWRLGFGMGAAS